MIKQFFIYFKVNVLREIQYRQAAISGVLTQMFFGLMYFWIYQAFFKSNFEPENFTLMQMANYIWLQQIFFQLFQYYDGNKEISQQIVSGDVSYQLLRPINLYNQWYYTFLGTNVGRMLVRAILFIPLLFLISLLPGIQTLSLPASAPAFLLFCISLILGAFLVVALNMFSYILVTITLSPTAVFGFTATLSQLLSGAIIPLPLLPEPLANAFNFLPFRYITDLPFRIYMGNILPENAIVPIVVQMFWLILLIFLGRLALNRRTKKFVVQGG